MWACPSSGWWTTIRYRPAGRPLRCEPLRRARVSLSESTRSSTSTPVAERRRRLVAANVRIRSGRAPWDVPYRAGLGASTAPRRRRSARRPPRRRGRPDEAAGASASVAGAARSGSRGGRSPIRGLARRRCRSVRQAGIVTGLAATSSSVRPGADSAIESSSRSGCRRVSVSGRPRGGPAAVHGRRVSRADGVFGLRSAGRRPLAVTVPGAAAAGSDRRRRDGAVGGRSVAAGASGGGGLRGGSRTCRQSFARHVGALQSDIDAFSQPLGRSGARVGYQRLLPRAVALDPLMGSQYPCLAVAASTPVERPRCRRGSRPARGTAGWVESSTSTHTGCAVGFATPSDRGRDARPRPRHGPCGP